MHFARRRKIINMLQEGLKNPFFMSKIFNQASWMLQILGTMMGFPSPSYKMVIHVDSINPVPVFKICNKQADLPLLMQILDESGIISLVRPTMWWLIIMPLDWKVHQGHVVLDLLSVFLPVYISWTLLLVYLFGIAVLITLWEPDLTVAYKGQGYSALYSLSVITDNFTS